MPTMATPYVVPKVSLNKNARGFEISPKIKSTISQSPTSQNASGSCRFSCVNWCSVCNDNLQKSFVEKQCAQLLPTKRIYNNGSLYKSDNFLTAPPRNDPYVEYKPFKFSPPERQISLKLEHRNSVSKAEKKPQFSPVRSNPNGNRTWSNNVFSEDHYAHEQYLREVEALRGKLRELRGSLPAHRQLPEVPPKEVVSSKNITSQHAKPEPQRSKVCEFIVNTPDSKRMRQISDSEACYVNGSVYASPKRPRDSRSPKTRDEKSPKKETITTVTKDIPTKEPEIKETVRVRFPARTATPVAPTAPPEQEVVVNTVSVAHEKKQSIAYYKIYSDSSSEDVEEEDSEPKYTFDDYAQIVESTPKETHLPRSRQPHADPLNHISAIKLDDKDLHPCLRTSLFPNIPPFIKFASDTCKAEKPFPTVVQRSLKWKLTTITPIVVKKVVQNSGYKFIRIEEHIPEKGVLIYSKSNLSCDSQNGLHRRLARRIFKGSIGSPDWTGIWGKHMKSVVFRTLKDNQKLNHFPGTFQIGRKDRLWKNLFRYMSKHGKKEFGFMPRTFVLPQDLKQLRAVWDKSENTRWIVKPPASARGTGIKVVHKWSHIPKKTPLVIQKYISNPYLINGSKFDLRLYVLVTSFDPLRVYIYDNGLVRFASAKYSDDLTTLSDRYIHLTNYSINKLSHSYASNEDAEACVGHKWTLRSLWSYLEGSVNVEALWTSLVELVIKTMICGESSISQLSRLHLTSRYCAYELFGVDVLLDENLKPWLLEVNISPSLHSNSPLDTAVKGPLVTNILNMVGYHIPNTLSEAQQKEASQKMGVGDALCLDQRLYSIGLSAKEKSKHVYYNQMEDRDLYLETILKDLTPDDVRHLTQYEDELTQVGNFQKIFPTPKTQNYHHFLEGQRYYNMLFDAWECQYSTNRNEGVELLKSLCSEQVHLDVKDNEPRTASTYVTETSSFTLVAMSASQEGSTDIKNKVISKDISMENLNGTTTEIKLVNPMVAEVRE